MIVKGGSRGGPGQLAKHLLRTDTNERVIVLENNSPYDLHATFRDWQTLCEGTRSGKLGLYHVSIDPDARYDMTPAQWARAVEVLEKELGLDGQPRAVVMHEKQGRQHIHVVWQRTDTDTMTLRSDSHNYEAHERASLRMEQEFGHEHVPGKHAKRDRKKQPEFPRAEYTHAEWQQAERAALSVDDRRAQNRAIKESCDSGMAFKAAIEEAGYVLARGNSTDFVLVTTEGSSLSLPRELKMKAAEVRAFMADVDKAALPTAAEAKAIQRTRETMPAPEAIPPQPEQDAPPVPEKTEQPEAAAVEPPAAPVEETYEDRLRKAVARRQEDERWKWRKLHGLEIRRTNHILEGELTEKMAHFDAVQEAAREIQKREHQKQRDDIWERLQRRINPVAVAERTKQREAERKALYRAQARERRDYFALQLQTKQMEMDALRERHEQKMRELEVGFTAELERYLRDYDAAQEFWQKLRDRRAARQAERDKGPWPDLPPPRRGK